MNQRFPRTVIRCFLATIMTVGASLLGPLEPASAQEELREQAIRRANGLFRRMRRGVWTARMSGCAGWSCNDATLYLDLPGKVRIEYDHNATLVSDGSELVTYTGDTETDRTPLAEAELSLLLKGELGDEVNVDAVEVVDRGPMTGKPRRVIQMEVSDDDGQRLTLHFSKAPFRFVGWRAPGPRGDFHASVRDLRRTRRSVDFAPAEPSSSATDSEQSAQADAEEDDSEPPSTCASPTVLFGSIRADRTPPARVRRALRFSVGGSSACFERASHDATFDVEVTIEDGKVESARVDRKDAISAEEAACVKKRIESKRLNSRVWGDDEWTVPLVLSCE